MSEIAEPFEGFLRFDDLLYNDSLDAAFTLGYRFEDVPDDPWTVRFTAFKFDGDLASVKGAARLMAAVAPLLVGGLRLKANRTVFVPAMRSGETSAQDDGELADIARRCAAASGCGYRSNALSKSVHLPTGRGRLDPEFRVLLVEYADYRSDVVDADTVIIVDDMIATGKTLSLAATALRRANPGLAVYGFAVAKAAWRGQLRLWHGQDVSNDHIVADWAHLWRSS